MEGYVLRRRDRVNFVWSERYLILDKTKLFMFKRQGDPTPRRTIVLTPQCNVGEVVDSKEKIKHHDQMWIFRLNFSTETTRGNYIDFATKSEEESRRWKAVIERAIAISKAAPRHETSSPKRDIGQTPATVAALLSETGKDGLVGKIVGGSGGDGQQSGDGETLWRIHEVESGLRILKEYPLDQAKALSRFLGDAHSDNFATFASAGAAVGAGLLASSIPGIGGIFTGLIMSLLAACGCVLFFLSRAEKEIATFKVSEVVRGRPDEVFRCITDPSSWLKWDCAAAESTVIEKVDKHSEILHIVLRPIWIWPVWHRPRDLCVMRYWRGEEDGSFLVIYQSTNHSSCPATKKYVRALMPGAAFVVAPRKPELSQAGAPLSMVTYVVRYSPGGWADWWTAFGKGLEFARPMLHNVISIRDEMAKRDFVDPIISQDVSSKGQVLSVDHKGLVLGVKKVPCSFPPKYWAEPDASKFRVRGATYLSDKSKVAAGTAAFHLVAVDVLSFEDPEQRYHVCQRKDSLVAQFAPSENRRPSGLSESSVSSSVTGEEVESSSPFTFAVNFVIPCADNLSVVSYFQPADPEWRKQRSNFTELLCDFMEGDDEFRNTRFKLIPNVVEGSFIIKQAVGSRPAIIGNKGLRILYNQGPHYFEVDVDIDSDSLARNIVGMILGVTKSLTVDVAFVIEGQAESELPETVLGAVRFSHADLSAAKRIPKEG